jgi:hypothetical protein
MMRSKGVCKFDEKGKQRGDRGVPREEDRVEAWYTEKVRTFRVSELKQLSEGEERLLSSMNEPRMLMREAPLDSQQGRGGGGQTRGQRLIMDIPRRG